MNKPAQSLDLAPIQQPAQEIVPAGATSPAEMMRVALSSGMAAAEIRELLALQREWEANEAKKAFNAAFAAFKAESVVIRKDRENKQCGSRYTSIGNLVDTVAPFLSKHGLSHEWDQDQADGIKVTCTLSHALGHSRTSTMKVPPDTSGAKNPIQQIKSSITYARSVTFEAVCGLAATDANVDDDGGGAEQSAEQQEAARKVAAASEAISAKIAKAQTIPELQAIKPEIVDMPETAKANLRAIYHKRLHELQK